MVDIQDIEYRPATRADDASIRALLAASGLPADDVAADRQDYLLAVSSGALVGCVGLERCREAGLLRSLAVAPALRNRGLGSTLLDRIVAYATAYHVTTAYALTTTAERFCLAHGFEPVDRGEVPPAVAATAQFRELCPATARCFRRRLG